MTELVGNEDMPFGGQAQDERHDHESSPRVGVNPRRVGLAVAALGVVYGDIGTSPLYSLRAVFSIDHSAVGTTPADVYGVISLVFWSITLVVSLKYVTFVLRADNNGEGGVMAIAALVRRVLKNSSPRRRTMVMALGIFGASLFYGDSMITPAISVLSAVEGLSVPAPSLSRLVIPLALVILMVLFAVQHSGTGRVGKWFGPVMLMWFGILAATGLVEVVPHPAILRGLSPSYAFAFVAAHPYTAFIALGAVVLVITGAEALYADLGQFGARPIRQAWFVVVFPALTLNYLAQGALILRQPSSKANPFFMLVPGWAQIPMVVLATIATVIAAQAVITGAFSVSRQAVLLGFLPHLRIRHTSEVDLGQVYVPVVNWALFVSVVVLILGFGSSAKLATAYGVAVTGTFLITTALFLVLARVLWHWAAWKVGLIALVFGTAEIIYFSANITKIVHGGWLPLLVAAAIFTIMTTWRRGREVVATRRAEREGPLLAFINEALSMHARRVPGTAIYPHMVEGSAPLALRINVERNQALHQQIVIVSARTADVPHISWPERWTCEHLGEAGDGIIHVAVNFGFQDRSDVPEALRQVSAAEPEDALDLEHASYFLSRTGLRMSHQKDMKKWRKRLFIVLSRNATSQTEYLWLPEDQTVTLSSPIDI